VAAHLVQFPTWLVFPLFAAHEAIMTKSWLVWSAVAVSLFVIPAGDVQAETVSKGIAKTLQSAQNASKSRKWSACLSDLRQAEGTGGLTPYDIYIINELRGYCAFSSGDTATALRAYETNLSSQFATKASMPGRVKALMQIHYNAKNYGKAIEYGQRAISNGTADTDVYTLIAQSHYVQNDFKNARDFTSKWIADQEKRGQTPKQNALNIYLTSCMKLNDSACTSSGFEKLVSYYPNPDAWANLMQSLFKAGDEASMLQTYRLATEVGAMRNGSDYTEMAQLALERGLPAEAQSAIEAGFARKAFADQREVDRNNRLLANAKGRIAADKAGLAQRDKQAAAGKDGNADLAVAESYLSYGQYAEAVAVAQRAIAKGVKNAADAQLVLGIAQYKAGNKADAVKAFKAAKGNESLQRLAKLWSLRAS
jgi:Tetratricopeptide repeat